MIKKILICLALSLILSVWVSAGEAQDITEKAEISGEGISISKITDGNLHTYSVAENGELWLSAENIRAVYLRYAEIPEDSYLTAGSKTYPLGKEGFYTELLRLDEPVRSVSLFFGRGEICEINIYTEGNLPESLQEWRRGGYADLMLYATHSDDDQLFFAGLLPKYSGTAQVQVVYFTSHDNAKGRRQELLSGLWRCGIRSYPEFLHLPDAYSESYEGALNNLASSGFDGKWLYSRQEELLEKYRPKVCVLHDMAGEYGHGQHILYTRSFIDCLENTQGYTPDKVYIHLYDKNPISLDIDTPLEEFSGKSAFQVSQDAFLFHTSQHWTWFYDWLYGKGGEIKSAEQIERYSPRRYGLYFSKVGEDALGDDMLENILTYAEEEEIRKEAEARAQKEEENRQKAEQKAVEDAKMRQKEAEKRQKILLFGALSVVFLLSFGFTIKKKIKK